MTVVTFGPFDMFGTSNRTIQGAIVQGGGSASGDTKFTELISHSTTSKFHPTYAGTITNLNQVNNSLQYRGYPYSPSGGEATVYNYYLAGTVLKSNLSTTYGSTSGYIMSYRVTSTASSIDSILNYQLFDPSTNAGFAGNGPYALDLEFNDGYLYAISTVLGQNTNSTSYAHRYVQVFSNGYVRDVGTYNDINNTVSGF